MSDQPSTDHAMSDRTLDGCPTIVCFSHLRWNFVFQRPQHLMTRLAATHHVVFWEEPEWRRGLGEGRLRRRVDPAGGVVVLTPELDDSETDMEGELRRLLDAALAEVRGPLIRWYYTPMMLPWSSHAPAACVVYDCMDELAAFKGAPPELLAREEMLLAQADLVFTGGASLHEAKRDRHADAHLFPSSVDVAHFARARTTSVTPPSDQAAIPGPRLGFAGVVDERMDLDLLAHVADARPGWSIVVVGPVVKIDEDDLPRRSNIHYLGARAYAALPDHMAGWDVALMPFAINEATRFISPTKTPEYLAAGLPVVSTPVVDVVRRYRGMAAWSDGGVTDVVRARAKCATPPTRCSPADHGPPPRSRWRR